MENISMEYCEVFVCVARTKSFTAAARELYISQPAVTYKIASLEEQLDCRLFVRTSRGVELTYEGELLYQACEPAFKQISGAFKTISELKNLNVGLVRVGVNNTVTDYLIKRFTAIFSRFYPGIAVSLSRMEPEIIYSSLQAGWIDFAVFAIALLPPYKKQAAAEIPGLVRTDLGFMQDALLAGSKYAYLANKILSVDELSRLPLILPIVETEWKTMYMHQFRPEGEMREIDTLLNTAEARVSLAMGNKGFTPFPSCLHKNDISAGNVVVLNSEAVMSRYDAYVLSSSTRSLNGAAEKFLEMFLEQAKTPE